MKGDQEQGQRQFFEQRLPERAGAKEQGQLPCLGQLLSDSEEGSKSKVSCRFWGSYYQRVKRAPRARSAVVYRPAVIREYGEPQEIYYLPFTGQLSSESEEGLKSKGSCRFLGSCC